MAGEKHQIPTDPLTGLSYPFVPIDPRPDQHDKLWCDYHHLEFERNNPLLQGIGGRAVRASIGQLMPRWQHNLIHQLGDQPALPESEDEQFRAAVIGCARLLGPQALDMSREEWWVPIEMTSEQYAAVTEPFHMYTEDAFKRRANHVRTHIGRFFATYALSRDLTHLSKKGVRQFLATKDPIRKKELGHWLLSESIEVAVSPMRSVQYELLRRRPLEDGPRVDLRRAVRGFFVRERFGDYYGLLSERLLDISWV
jgi:hypothetical protein